MDDAPFAGDDACTIWSKFDRAAPELFVKDMKTDASLDIPEAHRMVIREEDDDVSSRSKRDRFHRSRVSVKRPEQLAGLCVLYLDNVITAF